MPSRPSPEEARCVGSAPTRHGRLELRPNHLGAARLLQPWTDTATTRPHPVSRVPPMLSYCDIRPPAQYSAISCKAAACRVSRQGLESPAYSGGSFRQLTVACNGDKPRAGHDLACQPTCGNQLGDFRGAGHRHPSTGALSGMILPIPSTNHVSPSGYTRHLAPTGTSHRLRLSHLPHPHCCALVQPGPSQKRATQFCVT